MTKCISCGKTGLDKDTVGINKKLISDKLTQFYCMDCLAEYCGVTIDELNDKIEEFKEQGCILFK